MKNWKHKVKIKHLLVKVEENEDPMAISNSMRRIGEELGKHKCFDDFGDIIFFDDHFEDFEDANYAIEHMYNYADSNDIWIE